MVIYYSKRHFIKKKKKRLLWWQCLTPGLADMDVATIPNLNPWQTSVINYDILPFKPRCAFKILLNTVLLVTASNILELEHKMNPICQSCLRPEKKK